VSVMGESPDFAPFAPRLARYHMGMDDTVAEATVANLRDLLAEMERRGKVLTAQPGQPPKTSRKLADKPGLGLHPLVFAIDECHELFMHRQYGKEAADLAVRLIKRGRKYGIVLVLATQSPTKDSIPREVTRNISCGVAFAVADHIANDGLLGTGKFRAGVRATDLRMHTDRGTAVAVGVSDATFELIRWFYIPFEEGTDAVTPVIGRAMALLAEHGHRTTTRPEPNPGPAVDFLADLLDVLGPEPRVRTQVVLARLTEHNQAVYEGWTFTDLHTALAEHDLKPVKSDGRMVVRATDVTTAVNRRHHNHDDDPSSSDLFTDSDGDPGGGEGS
jgi:S-DNA-T family DNA segregation ATPase FtsK/SpoIIIE